MPPSWFTPTVANWVREHAELVGELRLDAFPGGRSNLTFRVRDEAGRKVVLRRPPLGLILPTAHDMAREYRFLVAMSRASFPAPRPLALVESEELFGFPCYLMTEAIGLVVRDEADAVRLDPLTRAEVSATLVDTLVQLHELDPDALGLTSRADPRTYLERQLNRWVSQAEHATTLPGPLLAELGRVGARLRATAPATRRIGIVHGDFRLDNLVIDEHGSVVAVLDWEIAAIGDTLADLGMLGTYWQDPDDELAGINPATTLPGFLRRKDVLARYARLVGVEVPELDWYLAFGHFKLAAILVGVVERYRFGAPGGDPRSIAEYPRLIEELVRVAATGTSRS